MKKRILSYRRALDERLSGGGDHDWERLRDEHLVQLSFFQHERLVHLIVTALFALLELVSLSLTVLSVSPAFPALAVVTLILLVPYIVHYYTLENEVQKLYTQYDRLCEKCGQTRRNTHDL